MYTRGKPGVRPRLGKGEVTSSKQWKGSVEVHVEVVEEVRRCAELLRTQKIGIFLFVVEEVPPLTKGDDRKDEKEVATRKKE